VAAVCSALALLVPATASARPDRGELKQATWTLVAATGTITIDVNGASAAYVPTESGGDDQLVATAVTRWRLKGKPVNVAFAFDKKPGRVFTLYQNQLAGTTTVNAQSTRPDGSVMTCKYTAAKIDPTSDFFQFQLNYRPVGKTGLQIWEALFTGTSRPLFAPDCAFASWPRWGLEPETIKNVGVALRKGGPVGKKVTVVVNAKRTLRADNSAGEDQPIGAETFHARLTFKFFTGV
jgi:hypothetical protein